MVYGIVKQHGGFINVDSQLGVGTAFTIYLPLTATHTTVKENFSAKIIPLHGGGETILLVEDDGEVRQLLKDVLESHEYKVIEAENGAEGVEKFKEHQNEIHILLTDVMMPVKNGRETYDEIKSIKSDVKAIFMSGYSASLTQGLLSEELYYLAKPVSPHDLIAKIHEVLSK
jgi:CheY-like chemotaxis protein